MVVITGGGTCNSQLKFLGSGNYKIRNLPIHLETCGAYPIQGEMDWITSQSKNISHSFEENLKLADEFKIIIEMKNSMQEWASMIDFEKYGIPTWLHPEWSVTRNNLVLESITTWVRKKNGSPYRVGFQLHKLFRQMKKTKELDPLHHYQKTLTPF